MIRLAFSFLVAFAIFSFSAAAHSYKQGDISVGHIWAKSTPDGAASTEVYVPLLNNGKEADKLTGASAEWADQVIISEPKNENGVVRMITRDEITLAPNKPVSLLPNGLHLMATGLKQPLKEGTMVPITLNFAKAGAIKVEVKIESPK